MARLLAGLPSEGTPEAEAIMVNPAWVAHASEMERAWQSMERRQLLPLRNWAFRYLGWASQSPDPVVYPFSGPDILYPMAFFPNASVYVLCGLEPVGPLPRLEDLPPEILGWELARIRRTLDPFLKWSFFITKDMRVELSSGRITGVLPVFYLLLARMGATLHRVEYVSIGPDGSVLPASGGRAVGVRITFSRGPQLQTLYYFTVNLENDALANQPGFFHFCQRLPRGPALVKAASYLLHSEAFSRVRDFLLAHSTLIVQDDSGIPIRFFLSGRWTLRVFGNYIGPIPLFKNHYQPLLTSLYLSSNPPPLPFGFGYQWRPERSSLIVATARTGGSSLALSPSRSWRPWNVPSPQSEATGVSQPLPHPLANPSSARGNPLPFWPPVFFPSPEEEE
ncbi:hypothetical protein [Candidatus Methylacidithermus pantelleriae]|uniref:hypothetical protein n=1 Tax=Candidatus Methylacidithermus pantelleriae TaxID=2744239 RepID=UPI00157D6883|nr:hypothetical protein [Candidatus Methylacidithermus pantelleriae]